MPLWNPDAQSADQSPFSGGLMGGVDSGALLSALGASLLTSPRNNPGQNFASALSQANKDSDLRMQRQAAFAIFKKAGYSDAEALQMSAASPGMASIAVSAIQQKQQQDADRRADEVAGGGSGGAAGSPGGAPKVSIGDPNEIENKFMGVVKTGVTNPYGLAAVAAYGNAESGYSPDNVNRTWDDGKAQSGGIMSWNGPRLAAMQRFTAGAQDPVTAQGQFFLKENPALIEALNNAKSAPEAHGIMADAWRFKGYDQPGGESARRLALTRQYYDRYGRPTQVADASGQTVPQASAAPIVASDEAETQAAERATGMVPPLGQPTRVAGPAPSVDEPNKPVVSSANAQFAPPGTAPAAPEAIAPFKSAEAAKFSYDAATKALGTPNISDTKRRQLEAAQKRAYDFLLDSNRVGSEANQRRQMAKQMGIDENTEQGKAYILTGKLPDSTDKLTDEYRQRQNIAAEMGLKKGTPAYQSYMLTGRPMEMSAADKEAVQKADDTVSTTRSAITNLQRAIELSAKAYDGGYAAERAGAANALGSKTASALGIDQSRSIATSDLNILIKETMLPQLKVIFGGNPSDKESKVLSEVQGAANQPRELRDRIITRAIEAARTRLEQNKQRAAELRGGTYYEEKPAEAEKAPEPKKALAPLTGNNLLRAREYLKRGKSREEVSRFLESNGVSSDGL